MDWIKKHYDRFALLVLAVILTGSSGFLIWSVYQLPGLFSAANDKPLHSSKLSAVDSAPLDAARKSLDKPAGWATYGSSLFVSRRYVVKDGQLFDPLESGEMLHPPVPNKWILDQGLDILDNNVLSEDPSGDGFTNLEKWQANCTAMDPASHPAFITKLRLKKFSTTPFHFKFEAYEGDTLEVNPLDLHKGTQFLKLNEQIKGSKFTITKFEKIIVPDPRTGGVTDKSQLTIQNSETGETLILPLGVTVNSPDSVGIFRYLWDNTEFQVRRGQSFKIKPQTEVEYKLIDIQENEAVIIDPKKEDTQIKVSKLEP